MDYYDLKNDTTLKLKDRIGWSDPDDFTWKSVAMVLCDRVASLEKTVEALAKKLCNTRMHMDTKPCPCTATKTDQCGEWCFYFPYTGKALSQ